VGSDLMEKATWLKEDPEKTVSKCLEGSHCPSLAVHGGMATLIPFILAPQQNERDQPGSAQLSLQIQVWAHL
jgi:hypothetical protein